MTSKIIHNDPLLSEQRCSWINRWSWIHQLRWSAAPAWTNWSSLRYTCTPGGWDRYMTGFNSIWRRLQLEIQDHSHSRLNILNASHTAKKTRTCKIHSSVPWLDSGDNDDTPHPTNQVSPWVSLILSCPDRTRFEGQGGARESCTGFC